VSKAELILLDIALSKIQIGQAFRIQGPLHNALVGLHDSYSSELIDEMNKILISSPDIIRNLLLEEDYTKCIDHSTHQDILTEKGKQAKKLGGHEQYKEWEKREKKNKDFEEFPKKKWHIYEPVKYIIFFGLGWLVNYLICTRMSPYNEKKQIPTQDTIRQIKPSQPSPISSGKKGSP
jgi:hypothetical protein